MDYDAVIIGGGPAGLTAGALLAQAKYRVLLLEKGELGGPIKNQWVDSYPGYSEGVSGAILASEMVDEAVKRGVSLEHGEVVEIESYSSCKSVCCADGKAYTCSVVIIAGGSSPKKLAVPGEEIFEWKGMIHCARCDGGLYVDRVVAVCGGGDTGISEALYLADLAAKVIVIEAQPSLTATAILQERAYANLKMEIRCGVKVVEIAGEENVRLLRVANATTGRQENLDVDGVLVQVGFEPVTGYLEGILPLDNHGYIEVNNRLETGIPGIFAAGGIRSGSLRQLDLAVGDGATVADSAQRFLQSLG